LSRFVDLLNQIPPGKEEIPEKLLKKLDIAASNLVRNDLGLNDELSEEERRNADYDNIPELYDRRGKWGLLDKWPLKLGDLVIFRYEKTNYWNLGISFGSNPYVVLDCGSKKEILEEKEQLNKYRETEGEEAFQEEIMRLIDEDLRREDY
jgi:hypothetical protein